MKKILLSLVVFLVTLSFAFAQPDLVINDTSFFASTLVDGQVFLNVVVGNVGNESANYVLPDAIILEVNSTTANLHETFIVKNIEKNSTMGALNYEIMLTPGASEMITVRIDSTNVINESNETNNVETIVVTAAADTSYDVSVSPKTFAQSIDLGTDVMVDGSFDISLDVKNNGTKIGPLDGAYVVFSELISGSYVLSPSTRNIMISTIKGDTDTFTTTYTGFDSALLNQELTFTGQMEVHYNEEVGSSPAVRVIPVSLTVDGTNMPIGVKVTPSTTQTITKIKNNNVVSGSVLSFEYDVTNSGEYASVDVTATAGDLVLSTSNAVSIVQLDKVVTKTVADGTPETITFDYEVNDVTLANVGTYNAQIIFETAYGNVTRDIRFVLNPENTQGNTTTNTSTNTTIGDDDDDENYGNKLVMDINSVKINGKSDDDNRKIGDDEDLSFGDAVIINIELENIFPNDDDEYDIDNIEFELEYDDELDDADFDYEVGDYEDDMEGDDRQKSIEITFNFPEAIDIDPEDIKDDYDIKLIVTGEQELENGTDVTHRDEIDFVIEFDQESELIIPMEVDVTPSALDCYSDRITISGELGNYGTKDIDDVTIKVYNLQLGIEDLIEVGDIEEGESEDFSATFDIKEIDISGTEVIKMGIRGKGLKESAHSSTVTLSCGKSSTDDKKDEVVIIDDSTNQKGTNGNDDFDALFEGAEFTTSENTKSESASFFDSTTNKLLIALFVLVLIVAVLMGVYYVGVVEKK